MLDDLKKWSAITGTYPRDENPWVFIHKSRVYLAGTNGHILALRVLDFQAPEGKEGRAWYLPQEVCEMKVAKRGPQPELTWDAAGDGLRFRIGNISVPIEMADAVFPLNIFPVIPDQKLCHLSENRTLNAEYLEKLSRLVSHDGRVTMEQVTKDGPILVTGNRTDTLGVLCPIMEDTNRDYNEVIKVLAGEEE